MAEEFDLFVLGAGSGGVRASRMAAAAGARVAIAEDLYLGGTCVNVGCIPKKLFVYAGHFASDFEDAAGFGWQVGASRFDWATLRDNKDVEIARLGRIYKKLLDDAGVAIADGHARITGPHEVEVAGKTYRAERLLVATGSWPFMPDIPGIEHALSSNEMFHLERFPERLIVVGGGYIAVELAGAFHGMGSQVTQLYRGPLFLRGFDDDLRTTLADEMRKREVDLRFETDVRAIEKTADGVRVELTKGEPIDADGILFATGRLPKTHGIGLPEIGIELGPKGEIPVDAYSRTKLEHVYAIGDCTDRLNLTPVAIHEAMAFVRTVYGGEPTAPDHGGVPTAVFSEPSLGTVGPTEAEAREAHPGDIAIYRSKFRALKHTLTGRDEQTLMKLIVRRSDDRVIGCHMLGPDAGEITQGLGIALKCGATKAQFDATVGIHPTAAEEFVTMRAPVEED